MTFPDLLLYNSMRLGKPNNLPTFLIIGAAKAGTTSLYHYLAQHPQVHMSPVKEPKFFAFEGRDLSFKGNRKVIEQINSSTIRDIESYKKLFNPGQNQLAIGEASPIYLHNQEAPANIRRHVPGVKMIVVLRNPMERAYSDWKHNYREGFESMGNFLKAVNSCEKREAMNFAPYLNYLVKGYYSKHLRRYFQLFNRRQILTLLYEDLCHSPEQVLVSIFNFLELNLAGTIDTSRKYMVGSKIYRNSPFAKASTYFKGVARKISGPKYDHIFDSILRKIEIPNEISNSEYEWLLNRYREDILDLQCLLNRDLTGWLNPRTRIAKVAEAFLPVL